MPQISSTERNKIVETMRAQNRATDAALWSALRRAPGLIAGGTVDLANWALGLLTGRGAKGLVDKPIGGGESINEAFGMPKSSDTTQNIAELALSMLSPGGAAKAIILPAALLKPMKDIKSAVALTRQGKADVAWRDHGVYIDPLDGEPKALIDPRNFKIPDVNISTIEDSSIPFTKTPLGIVPSDKYVGPMSGVVDAPELFNNTFGLNITKLVREKNPANLGSYNPYSLQLGLSYMKDKQQLKEILGHELQHGVQFEYGFAKGGDPKNFYSTEKAQRTMYALAKDLLQRRNLLYKAEPNIPASERTTYNLIDQAITDLLRPLENARAESFKNYERLGGEAESRAVEAMLRNPILPNLMSPLDIQIKELAKKYGAGTTRISGPGTFVDWLPETQEAMTKLRDPNIRSMLNQFTDYLKQRVKP